MSRRIRIFYEVFGDDQNVNAQSLNARGIALRLDPENFESSFLVTGRPDPKLVGKPHIRFIRLPSHLKGIFAKMYLLCSSEDILVYPRYSFHRPLFSIVLRRSLRRKKLVCPVEAPLTHLQKENPNANKRIRRILRKSDFIVPISDYISRDLQENLRIEAHTIIPGGIDTRFFYPIKRSASSTVRVLFVGRLIDRKGLETIVEAAVLFPEVHFRIVGSAYGKMDGAFARRMRQRVNEDNLKNVAFVGTLSQEQLRQLMWDSDILLHPSRIEGIPRVTQEAGATGMPSIIFDDYRTPSVVDGVTGFQVKTFEEMIDRLRLLIDNGDLRSQMGAAAVELVKQFDCGVVAKRWEEVFKQLTPN